MLIDHHVHMGIDENKTNYSLDSLDLLNKMDEFKIEKSIIFPCPNIKPVKVNPYQYENERILKIAAKESRFIPFMFVNPLFDSKEYILSIKEEFEGFKMHSSAKEMEYDYRQLLDNEIMEILTSTEKPIIFHTGLKEKERGKNLIEIAKKHRGKIIVAHVSRFYAEDLEKMHSQENMLIDLSPFNSMIKNPRFLAEREKMNKQIKDLDEIKIIKYLSNLFPKRIIWGTDSPWCNYLCPEGYKEEIELYQRLELENICINLF